MSEKKVSQDFIEKYFYYQIFKPNFQLSIDLQHKDLGVYESGIFISIIGNESTIDQNLDGRFVQASKVNLLKFVDAMFVVSKKLEPLLSISTRLYKLLLDDYQDKAIDLHLDTEMYQKIKTMYFGILQENATDELIEKGFEISMSDTMKVYVEKMLDELIIE
ncbi:MAG: hypothetical protein M9887_03215 [Chitinophagales bacterium]|nr:hypothetical protein [Chitinophagales bacterium]